MDCCRPFIRQMPFERFSKRGTLVALILSALYLSWVWLVIGLRGDHFALLLVCLILYFGTQLSRKAFFGLCLFAIYWLIYDSLRIYPNHEFNPVRIQELYELEKSFFGFTYNGQIVTPNEFWASNTKPVLDLLSGIFYLCWVPVPFLFAVWLLFKDKRTLLDFSFAFLLTNILGFILYYMYPAAPPWYVETYGFEKNFSVPGSEAGLANFDALLGIHLFKDMYIKNSNVFAAVPSLHAAYPIISLYFALKKRLRLTSILFFVILTGIWFSAIYTRHHYIIDVLLGALCALTTLFVYEKIILKTRANRWINQYVDSRLTA